MPQAEIDVDESLVRRLLRSLPEPWRDLREAPVEHVATGWDNSVWRLGVGDPCRHGPGYAVRIPVRRVAAPLILTAARWVGEVTGPIRGAGFRAPVPVHVADPADLVPWPWCVVEWVPGTVLSAVPVTRRGSAADGLAAALPLLHRPAPPNAPVNPGRGVPLAARRALTERHLPAARDHLGADSVTDLLRLVDLAAAAPGWPHAPVWCHGDLHAANLALDERGHSSRPALGFLDLDDLTSGDPAVDLRALWLVLDADQRERARRTLEASGAYDPFVWTRAKGWAAASFVLPVAADPEGRVAFADAIEHALDQLGCR
ncbi:phosphotransferase [Nostocoides sp. F2B08]|uniref:phosphotransferase n=1 Tax=Nostocoides sp. F2B08 TaxID=2653936 RepID=UPI001263B32C|nr:phosphotransferase [Tetrasphaera sp. F2B08]KAB7745154.1 phosphotransferase [Tetrasphaera sp. F2B08]